jgi:hypothetical protein
MNIKQISIEADEKEIKLLEEPVIDQLNQCGLSLDDIVSLKNYICKT